MASRVVSPWELSLGWFIMRVLERDLGFFLSSLRVCPRIGTGMIFLNGCPFVFSCLIWNSFSAAGLIWVIFPLGSKMNVASFVFLKRNSEMSVEDVFFIVFVLSVRW